MPYKIPTLVCVKAKRMKQAWCIAASDPSAVTDVLIHWYAKRWGIDPQLRDTKNLTFGMSLSATAINYPARRNRIFLIMILTLFSALGEKLGMDRYLKANTVKHCAISLFKQGVHYYCQIFNMTAPKLKTLFFLFIGRS